MKTILLIEDDENQRFAIADCLGAEGYTVKTAADGLTGETALKKDDFDIAIVDIMLPKKNGFDLLSAYRKQSGQCPFLLLTAKSDVADKVSGLRLGADDYLTKPFDVAELLARIEALLRRSHFQTDEKSLPILPKETGKNIFRKLPDFTFDSFTLKYKKMQLLKNGKRIHLSFLDFKILACLTTNQDEIVTHEMLIQDAWEQNDIVAPATIHTHVSFIRAKLQCEDMPSGYIQTLRSAGYLFSQSI